MRLLRSARNDNQFKTKFFILAVLYLNEGVSAIQEICNINEEQMKPRSDKMRTAQNLLFINVQPILNPSFMELSLAGV